MCAQFLFIRGVSIVRGSRKGYQHLSRRRTCERKFGQSLKSTSRVLSMATQPPIVLIDMDNTLVNFDKEFAKRWSSERSGDDPSIVLDRKHFELEENFDDSLRPLAQKIMGTPGFYIEFEPMPGALDAVRNMVAKGFEVVFCTAPHPLQWETCASEKYAWIRRHLGEDWMTRLLITRDKSVVKGNVLIDDKPAVTGKREPEWQHIVFTQSYNKDVEGKPRLESWSNWEEVVTPYLKS